MSQEALLGVIDKPVVIPPRLQCHRDMTLVQCNHICHNAVTEYIHHPLLRNVMVYTTCFEFTGTL